jgi:endonuclease YncB( thermonuclease family)
MASAPLPVFGPYPARVIDVHDGDTVTFDLDLGFGIRLPGQSWSGKTMLACRVYGINAPELNTAAGKDALAYARTLLAPGDMCLVASHGWDKYGGRYDGTITLPREVTAGDYTGTDFASLMLASGHAVRFL